MPNRSIDRRSFLRGVAALPLIGIAASTSAAATADEQIPAPLIVRQSSPENLEFPFQTLNSYITPSEKHYVRSHFAVPKLDAQKWQLSVEGAVEKAISFNYDELRQMGSESIVLTMECAGNGRVYLTPTARGVQWENGGVSTAEWTGVPLRAILEKVGLKPDAVDVILEGADSGEIKDPPKPAGVFHFSRSLPLAKARSGDVLLAYKMNGKELTPSHGFPVRAIVPGWYGMASVKWLNRIVVSTEPFHGHFQTIDYATFELRCGIPTRVAVTEMQVKLAMSRPTHLEQIKRSSKFRVHGAAWAGNADIVKVELSTDGGASWNEATFKDNSRKYTWRRWEWMMNAPAESGRHTLMCRATDSKGRVQPMTRDANRDNSMINHVVPVTFEVV